MRHAPGLCFACSCHFADGLRDDADDLRTVNGGDRGWSQSRIEQDRFRVRFAAGSDTEFDEAENMALRRAAEITLDNGGDWFLVTNRQREGNDRNPVGVSTGVSISSGSRGRSSRGVGLGLRFDGDAGEKSVSLMILIRSGPLPQDQTPMTRATCWPI